MTSERCADRGCRDSHAKPLEFALDALITPARILAGQADDQLLDVGIQLRPARSTMGTGPGTCDQPPMPAKQRFGLDEEAGPAGSRERAAQGGEHRPPLNLSVPVVLAPPGRVVRRDRLGGLIHEYAQVA
jgi:hypothetical protein